MFVAVTVNSTTFPDANFRNYVLQNITGGSTTLTDAKINSTTSIDVTGKSIANLKGIEYFTKLTWLSCDNNNLTYLDVSKNTKLIMLLCHNNSLTTLDVSKNTAPTYLNCCNNRLTSLDVSGATALTELYCGNNQLTSLDVSKNTKLTSLYCGGNQLTSLDVSKNTALKELNCISNQLTSLDVSKNTALTWLECYSNQLTKMDVSKNTALTYLHCVFNQLTTLDVSKNTKLTQLSCDRQYRSNVNIDTQSNTTYPFKYSIGTVSGLTAAGITVSGSNGSAISHTYSGGVINLAARPTIISYSQTLKAGSAGDTFNVSITCATVKPTITTSSLTYGIKGNSYSLTLAAPTNGTYPMSLSVSGLPSGLSYNASSRVISGTPSVSGSFNVTLTSSNTAGNTTKSLTLAVYEKPVITTTSLPAGINGTSYSTTLAATGTATLTWTVSNLPTGLSFNSSTLKITGTPTKTETMSVSITVKNSYGTATKSLNLVINQKPVIITTSFNTTIPGIYYYAENSATGTTPYTWSATDLPEGLSIDVSSGVISGIPTVSGDFNIKLNVKNIAGSYDKAISLHIEKLPESMQLWKILSDPTYRYTVKLADYIHQDIIKNLQNMKAKVLKTDENETETVYSNGVLKSQNLIELIEYDYVVKYADNKTYTLHVTSDLYMEEEDEVMPEDNYRDYAAQLRSEVKETVEYIKNAFVRV